MIAYDGGSLIDYINTAINENAVIKQKISSLCCTECTDSVIMLILFSSVFLYQVSHKVGFIKHQKLQVIPSYAKPCPLNILKHELEDND